LKVGGSLPVSAVQLPPGVTLLSDPDKIAVQCVVPVEAEEAEPGEGAAEPEVIGRKAEEESGEE